MGKTWTSVKKWDWTDPQNYSSVYQGPDTPNYLGAIQKSIFEKLSKIMFNWFAIAQKHFHDMKTTQKQ